jgi:hypothetical protein
VCLAEPSEQKISWNYPGFEPMKMRYVYLKENNAVREAERVLAAPDIFKIGGSDIFLAHFLEVVSGNPKLVLSLHAEPEHDAEYGGAFLSIKSYFWYRPWRVRFGRVFLKPAVTSPCVCGFLAPYLCASYASDRTRCSVGHRHFHFGRATWRQDKAARNS